MADMDDGSGGESSDGGGNWVEQPQDSDAGNQPTNWVEQQPGPAGDDQQCVPESPADSSDDATPSDDGASQPDISAGDEQPHDSTASEDEGTCEPSNPPAPTDDESAYGPFADGYKAPPSSEDEGSAYGPYADGYKSPTDYSYVARTSSDADHVNTLCAPDPDEDAGVAKDVNEWALNGIRDLLVEDLPKAGKNALGPAFALYDAAKGVGNYIDAVDKGDFGTAGSEYAGTVGNVLAAGGAIAGEGSALAPLGPVGAAIGGALLGAKVGAAANAKYEKWVNEQGPHFEPVDDPVDEPLDGSEGAQGGEGASASRK